MSKLSRLCLALFAVLVVLPSAAQNAPMFRENLQHTGEYSGGGVPSFPKIKWKFATHGQVMSSPAIADGTAYVGSTDGNLYAVDLESGAQKWKFATKVRVTSSPAVDSGVVFFESYDGNFYAVNATDGQLKWKFATAGERRFAGKHLHGSQPEGETMPDPFDFYLSSPAVWNGVVYFGSGDGNVYALDANTGTAKWQFASGNVIHASPALAEGLFLSEVGTAIFMRSTLSPGKRNGASRLVRTPRFTTKWGFSRLPRW